MGGSFSNIGGQQRHYIAALDKVTGMATNWNPNADYPIRKLTVSGSTVYAGGIFTNIGGQPRNRIAALDTVMGNATSWSPDADGEVWGLSVSGSTVYAGGFFHEIGNTVQPYFASITTGVTSVQSRQELPNQFKLIQNYPNPFNPSTKISYEVPKRTFVRLQIFNILGQLVQTLVDEEKQPGAFNVSWNAGNVPSGVYFYRINAGSFVDTKKMVVIR